MTLFSNFVNKTGERPGTFAGGVITRYKVAIDFVKGKKVLDIGTGLGDGAHFLAKNNAKQVIGIDCSKAAIIQAKEHFLLPNLKFQIMDARKLNFPKNSFDLITAFEIIEHLKEKDQFTFMKKVQQILKPKGILILSTPNRMIYSSGRTKSQNPYHEKEFSPKEMDQFIGNFFNSYKVMGIKCINSQFLKIEKRLKETSLKYKLVAFFSQFKITHELSPLIPERLRNKISSQDLLPTVTEKDFKVEKSNPNDCWQLLVIARKNE